MRPTRRWATGLITCAGGLVVAAAVQMAGPTLRPPLYDGVVNVEPYRFLQPLGTEAGGALTATRTIAVQGSLSPALAVGTPEQPPQAQLIAGSGALAMPAGTTSLTVTITPVAPAAAPLTGAVAGNVYRVSVVNQAGVAVAPAPGTEVTFALRDPGSTGLMRIEILTAGSWQALPTVSAAVSGTYETSGIAAFGDVALIETGGTGGAATGSALSPFAIVTAAAILLALIVVAVTAIRRRSAG